MKLLDTLLTTSARPAEQVSTASQIDRDLGKGGNGHGNGHGRRRHRPQIRDGVREAVLRADTAAQLVLDYRMPIHRAARRCGSNHDYVEAMLTLKAHGDDDLITAVMEGDLPLLPTAKRIKPMVTMKKAFNALSNLDRIEFARSQGAEKLFDEVICPAMEPPLVTLVVE